MKALALFLLTAALAQSTAEELTLVEAKPEDVATLDGVITAYYASLSGEGGDRRAHKKRYQSLFARFARVITPTLTDAQGANRVVARPIEDWMTRYPDFREGSFYEWEVARRTEQYGHMASVFSTYEIRTRRADEKPRRHGVTAFTLAYLDGRWWIVALQWSGVEASEPLPARYAP